MSRFSNFQRHCLSVAISQALLVPMVVQSATVEVDTVLDDNNPVGCSLREAVQTINIGLSTNNDCNAIGVFGANDQINFNLPSNSTITLSGSEIVVSSSVSINGPGASELTIDGNNQSRIFNINNAANSVVDGLTLTGGYTTLTGGALSVAGSQSFVLSNSVISSNVATGGSGGIHISSSSGSTINNSTISNNFANFADAGGIQVVSSNGMVILDSTITNNAGFDDGGGITFLNSNGASVINSTITGNSSYYGGAIDVGFSNGFQVIGSTIKDNSSYYCGGLDVVSSNGFEINDSTVIDNLSLYQGGGICLSSSNGSRVIGSSIVGNEAGTNGGGLDVNNVNDFSMASSTVANNSSSVGGGIAFRNDTSGEIINSTISGNTAEESGSGGQGGGIFSSTNNIEGVSLFANTLVGNRALSLTTNSGGGIYDQSASSIILEVNNVVANSEGGDCNGALLFGTNNWIDDSSCTGIALGDPSLGILRNNGGITLTHKPLLGSGLVGAGSVDRCNDAPINGVDQIGLPRGSISCTIGAVEDVESQLFVIPLPNGKILIFEL